MKLPLTGGCACGAIRFRCASAPMAMLNCHCRDCQRSSGAPFASGVVLASADLEVTGTPAEHAVQAGSGQRTRRSFCPACGTPLFTRGDAHPAWTSVRFSSLDDQAEFRPMLDIWAGSAPAWTCLDPAIPQFRESPPAPA